MKALVISDSHGNLYYAKNVLNKILCKIDVCIHLGDFYDDGLELARLYKIPFYTVRGNCDFNLGAPLKQVIELDGYRLLAVHGHEYRVKSTLLSISYKAKEENCDVALFGHSHYPILVKEDGLLLLNPGSISCPRGNRIPSYGILNMEEEITARIIGIYGNNDFRGIDKPIM